MHCSIRRAPTRSKSSAKAANANGQRLAAPATSPEFIRAGEAELAGLLSWLFAGSPSRWSSRSVRHARTDVPTGLRVTARGTMRGSDAFGFAEFVQKLFRGD